jgi:hypothetical protein
MLSLFACYDLFQKAKSHFCSAQRIQPTERTFLHAEGFASLAKAKNLKEANEVPNAPWLLAATLSNTVQLGPFS